MSIKAVETLVRSFLKEKKDPEPLRVNWYARFLKRHPNLKTTPSRALDQTRKDAITIKTLQDWFNLFQRTYQQYRVVQEDVYNMDEKGLMKGIGDDTKVIVSKEEIASYSIQPGNREWVSIIECINARAYSLPLFIIFEGK